jgi:hypothetical protein
VTLETDVILRRKFSLLGCGRRWNIDVEFSWPGFGNNLITIDDDYAIQSFADLEPHIEWRRDPKPNSGSSVDELRNPATGIATVGGVLRPVELRTDDDRWILHC